MSKRLICLIIVLILFAPGIASASFLNRLSLSLSPGMLFALRGHYNDAQKLSETVLPGTGFGLVLRYRINKNIFIDGSWSYNWMFFKKDIRPTKYIDHKPAFIAPMYTLNGTFFFAPGHTVEPYVTLGGGLCPWWFSSEAFGGELWVAPGNTAETFTKPSLSLNGGLGLEIRIFSKLSAFIEAKYYYIFSKDVVKFGTADFTNQDLLGVRLGLTYYFGQKRPVKKEEDEVNN